MLLADALATTVPIKVSSRIRPLRIGYRVNPLDGADLALAVETATSQWGGSFHPLIPVLKQRPRWWEVGPFPSMGPVAIENAYREAFDCDFVLDARPGAEKSPSNRFDEISFEQLRLDSGYEGIESGMPASAIYRQLWTEEFRWEGRGRPQVVIPEAREPAMQRFVDACFGRFANAGHLASFRGAYEQLLGAVPLDLTTENFLDCFPSLAEDYFLTPLMMSMHGLNFRPLDYPHRAEILLLDSSRPSDLFDFWNLRATGRSIVPIPLRWSEQLLPELGRRLAALPETRNGWDEDVLLIGARRLSEDAVLNAQEVLAAAGLQVFRSSMPGPRFGLRPAWVSAQEEDIELRPDRIGMTMPLAAPSVAEHHRSGVYRWMNVINYLPWTLPSDGSIGALLPPELGEVSGLLRLGSHIIARASVEGMLIPAGGSREDLQFTPPSGERILSQLLTGSPAQAKPTEPGRAATQLIKQMNGLYGVGLIQRRPLVELFNRAAHGGVAVEDAGSRPPRSPARSLPLKTLEVAVGEIHPKAGPGRANLMRGLVDRDVLRVGVRLTCSHCDYSNWVQLDDVSRTIVCERCLEKFFFPQQDPPHRTAWAYRPTGAFSIPDYANGGYAVAFALRFLSEDRVRSRASWCTGFQLDPANEIDFAAVIADDEEVNPARSLVLGEAKSFGPFKQRDFDRAALLAKKYPSAILAFATLRDEISEEEKLSLTALARPEAGSSKELPVQPRVLVLTATELFNRDGAPECWADSGGPGKAFAGRSHRLRSDVSTWADVTLQLHVGLGPHREWLKDEDKRLTAS